MQVEIYPDYAELSFRAADKLVKQIVAKPASVFCLASGESPLLTYALMTQLINIQKIDVSQCTFVGLDEWVGIPPDNPGSCHYFLQQYVFQPLKLKSHQIKLFNVFSGDLAGECKSMDSFVSSKGGIDMMVVGIGLNGHIGFNEPGVSPDHYSHVITLDEKTRTVGQKYFAEATELSEGITMGLKRVAEARNVLLLANGLRKADIIRQTLKEGISTAIPSTLIRQHQHATVMVDSAAASLV